MNVAAESFRTHGAVESNAPKGVVGGSCLLIVDGLMRGLLQIALFAGWIIKRSVFKPLGLDGAFFAQLTELRSTSTQ